VAIFVLHFVLQIVVSGKHVGKLRFDKDRQTGLQEVALVVDEWGGWYAPLPGINPGFLVQQNSMRDVVLAALNLNIFARHADRVTEAGLREGRRRQTDSEA
jgi:alpha-L-arabinofuranosidase